VQGTALRQRFLQFLQVWIRSAQHGERKCYGTKVVLHGISVYTNQKVATINTTAKHV